MEHQALQLQEARQRRQAVSWKWFVGLAAEECASRYEESRRVSPEWLIGEYWVRGVPTREEMLDLASRLVQMTEDASEHC